MRNPKQLYQHGKAQLNKGNYKDAINAFIQILEENPNLPAVWNKLGISFSEIKAYNKAVDSFKNGLKYDPQNKSLYHNLGIIYYRMQEYQKVYEIFKKGVELYPNYHFFWNNIGVACMFLGKIEESINAYKEALKLNTQYGTAWKNLCNNYSKIGVEFNFEDLKPNQELSWYFLAKALLNAELYDDSLDALNQCLHLNPGFHVAYKLRKEISSYKKLNKIVLKAKNENSWTKIQTNKTKIENINKKKEDDEDIFIKRIKQTQKK